MPQQREKITEQIRYNLTSSGRAAFEALVCKSESANNTECLRKALKLYSFALNLPEGSKLTVQHANGNFETIILL